MRDLKKRQTTVLFNEKTVNVQNASCSANIFSDRRLKAAKLTPLYCILFIENKYNDCAKCAEIS